MDESKKLERPSIDVVMNEMNELRRIQAQSIDAMDSKIGILLGFSATILAISLGSLKYETKWMIIFAILHIYSMVISLIFIIAAFRVRSFRFDPAPKTLIKDYMTRSVDSFEDNYGSKEQILADQVNAYQINEAHLKSRASEINYAIIFLFLGILFLVFQKIS